MIKKFHQDQEYAEDLDKLIRQFEKKYHENQKVKRHIAKESLKLFRESFKENLRKTAHAR